MKIVLLLGDDSLEKKALELMRELKKSKERDLEILLLSKPIVEPREYPLALLSLVKYDRVDQHNINVFEEYEKIQKKVSALSRADRNWVIREVDRLNLLNTKIERS